MKNYNVALYIRLSKEDSKNKISESVENQKILLLKYVKDNNYNLINYYIDDGYTGTNFNRPGFINMVKDINDKKVNMVVVKDLSRLGRDYIKVGYYTEYWFPSMNVRFVSILDNIDSFSQCENNDIAPFKSIFNDLYSKENSKKIRAALKVKQLEGKWVGGCCPFGYCKDKNDKNKLVIKEEEALIVRKIFSLFLSGKSLNSISNYLLNNNIFPPSVYRKTNKDNKYASLGFWSPTSIKNILRNQIYTGDMVQNRRKRISYKIRKIVKNSKDEWIIIPNTHESIVSKVEFSNVQKILENNHVRKKKNNDFLLSGLMFCGNCGRRIVIQKCNNNFYTVCNNYKKYSKLKLCSPHSNNYENIEGKIKKIIRLILKKIDIDKVYCDLKDKLKLGSQNKNFDNEIEKLNEILANCYIEKEENRVSNEIYEKVVNKINLKINRIKNINSNKGLIDYCFIKSIIENVNRELVLRLIEKIYVYDNKKIKVLFNFFNDNFIALS